MQGNAPGWYSVANSTMWPGPTPDNNRGLGSLRSLRGTRLALRAASAPWKR